MERKLRPSLAQRHGLEHKEKSGQRGVVFLDFPSPELIGNCDDCQANSVSFSRFSDLREIGYPAQLLEHGCLLPPLSSDAESDELPVQMTHHTPMQFSCSYQQASVSQDQVVNFGNVFQNQTTRRP